MRYGWDQLAAFRGTYKHGNTESLPKRLSGLSRSFSRTENNHTHELIISRPSMTELGEGSGRGWWLEPLADCVSHSPSVHQKPRRSRAGHSLRLVALGGERAFFFAVIEGGSRRSVPKDVSKAFDRLCTQLPATVCVWAIEPGPEPGWNVGGDERYGGWGRRPRTISRYFGR
jgi:hypothetical protein